MVVIDESLLGTNEVGDFLLTIACGEDLGFLGPLVLHPWLDLLDSVTEALRHFFVGARQIRVLVLLALIKHVYFLIDITVRNLGQQSVKLLHRALKLIGSCIECAANFLLLGLRSSYCVQFDAHRDR